jgi:hypothetical protein
MKIDVVKKIAKKILADSHSDFLMNYGSEIKEAISQMKEMHKIRDNLDDAFFDSLEKTLSVYDKPVSNFIDHYLGAVNDHIDANDITRIANDIQNRYGTERQMVIYAINDAYNILLRKGLVGNDIEASKSAASVPGRGWQGKLGHIDEFLKQVYDKMESADKRLKDSVFRSYYRHYNDGDYLSMPWNTLVKIGLDKENLNYLQRGKIYDKGTTDNRYEKALEDALDVTMKYLYKKYKGSTNRKTVNFEKLKDIAKTIKDYDFKDAYWVNKFADVVNDSELKELAKKLKEHNKDIHNTTKYENLPEQEDKRIRELVKEHLFNRM